jgi:hypothetical protein
VDKSDFSLILSLKQFEGEETGNPLEKALRFLFSLGLSPKTANFLDTPVPKSLVETLIKKISAEYQESRELREKQKEKQLQKEQQRYEDTNVKQALKVINNNIDRIDQILTVGKGILTFEETKTLTDLSNELKKIRLGSNFNRMVQLLMDTQEHIDAAEEKVLKQLDDKKFLIDRHSSITNIDVITEYTALVKAEEKYILKNQLDLEENRYLNGKHLTIFAKFFGKDIRNAFSSLEMLVPNMLSLLEYFILTTIVIISIFWLFSTLFASTSFLPHYLPMLGRMGLLLYGCNQLSLKNTVVQIGACVLLLILYFWGFALIKATFAF